MRISVKAKPGAKKAFIREEPRGLFPERGDARLPERKFVVAVTERAVENRANEAIIRAVAGYLKVPPSAVRIVAGAMSREKVLEIERSG